MSSGCPVLADIVQTYKDYNDGDVVTAINLDGNFNNIRNVVNGGLDNTNADITDGFRFIEIVSSLPAAGNQGRVVYLTTDNILYFDDGSNFLQSVVITGTKAQGDVIYYDGTNWVLLAKDTSASRYISNTGTGSSPKWATIDVTNGLSGTLPVASGGTGLATITDGAVMLGSGTGNVTPLPVTVDGSILIGDGTTDPVTLNAFSSSTGQLNTANGGTGQDFSAVHQGDIYYDNGGNAFVRLLPGTDGQFLRTSGPSTIPGWAEPDMALISVTAGTGTNSGNITIEASKQYLVTFNLKTSTTSTAQVDIDFQSDGGNNYSGLATGYTYADAPTEDHRAVASGTGIPVTADNPIGSNALPGFIQGRMYISTYLVNSAAGADISAIVHGDWVGYLGSVGFGRFAGDYEVDTTITDFEFIFGNNVTYDIKVYELIQS